MRGMREESGRRKVEGSERKLGENNGRGEDTDGEGNKRKIRKIGEQIVETVRI